MGSLYRVSYTKCPKLPLRMRSWHKPLVLGFFSVKLAAMTTKGLLEYSSVVCIQLCIYYTHHDTFRAL